jgi:hypothetical protein
MHSASRGRMELDGGLSGSPGAEEGLGDPEEADRMQLFLSAFCIERYKYMQYINQTAFPHLNEYSLAAHIQSRINKTNTHHDERPRPLPLTLPRTPSTWSQSPTWPTQGTLSLG